MKRDMDLIREIMQDIERTPAGEIWDGEKFAASRNRADVVYTVRLLEQHGFISECTDDTFNGIDFRGCRVDILPPGYDFLDASRNNTLWQKFKDKIKNETPAFTLKLAVELLFKMAGEGLLG